MANKSGIHIKSSHKGLLHKKLGIPEGKPIPRGILEKAAHSKSPSERKEVDFALNAEGWDHSKGAQGSPKAGPHDGKKYGQ